MWSILLAVLPFAQCKTPTYTPRTYDGSSVTFGSGGGITGHINCTTLLDNGHVFKGSGLTELEFEADGRLSQANAEQLFANYQILGLSRITFNEPGNTYQFIEHKEGDETHRITWSNKSDLPDPKVYTYYQILKNKTQVK